MENEVINLTEVPFCIGHWHIEPSLGRVTGGDSEPSKLEPQVMAVLLCLAKQQGQVVSRETIEAQAWPNRIVGYDSLSTAIIKLRKAFADDSKNPRYIETVPKKGYRLIMAITPAKTKKPKPIHTSDKTKPHRQKLTFILMVSLVLAGLSFVFYNKMFYLFTTTQITHNNTIAVLPFKNMSEDIQQEYFSDGITADLITDLSKISGLGVIVTFGLGFITKSGRVYEFGVNVRDLLVAIIRY